MGANSGSCSPLNKPSGTFYTADGGLTDTCPYVSCDVDACGPGTYLNRDGANADLVSCKTAADHYFVSNGGLTDSCQQQACSNDCGVGRYRSLYGYQLWCVSDLHGPPVDAYYTSGGDFTDSCSHAMCEDCAVGEYRNGCIGPSAGSCTSCTNKPNETYYVLSGDLSNACSLLTCLRKLWCRTISSGL